MADTEVLKTSAERRAGSNPATPTNLTKALVSKIGYIKPTQPRLDERANDGTY